MIDAGLLSANYIQNLSPLINFLNYQKPQSGQTPINYTMRPLRPPRSLFPFRRRQFHPPLRHVSSNPPPPPSSGAAHLPHRRLVSLRGPDAARFLQGVTTADVPVRV